MLTSNSCRFGALRLLSRPTLDQTFQLAVSNPAVPEINKLPLHANNFLLRAGPGVRTKTYCPPTFEYCNRTITNHTLFTASNGQWNLAISAPGGQQAFLSAEKYVGYTAAHHGDVDPRVAQADGFVAYLGGALINAKAPGWWACEILKADATGNKEWAITGIWSGRGNATGTRSRSLWDGDLGAVRVDVRSCVVVNILVQTSACERGKNLRAWEYA
ncbi:hypothetical protein BS50DRAFT_345716 [Corynespora cassiicola Philippines]|uniref:Uncharacterized protein n=1 Tax=Corynespora cassiicola Philippines TaxID=1448308 RepID=A0A2T2NQ73_CORCC|nr:hypothetical protein BS50DRAFT_345716 [Corynespora cassiicola Philippines]